MKPARIVVLVIAIAAGGVAALLAGRSDAPAPAPSPVAPLDTVDVLIANSDIGLGHTVSESDLRWQTWPAAAAGANFIRKSERPEAIKDLAGAITRASFSSGEPIRETKLIKGTGGGYMAAVLPSGMRAISTEISTETGAGGFILPNDHVDVLLTRRDKLAEKSAGVEIFVSEIILPNVRVLAIDQTVEEKNGQRVQIGKTATLELSPQQSEVLALSRQLGTISLALRSLVDFGKDGPVRPVEEGGSRRGVDVVRFGVTTTSTTK